MWKIGLPLAAAICGLASHLCSQEPQDKAVYDLDAYVIEDTNREFTPDFKTETPRLTYFEKPRLPNGEFILALAFIDRYAVSATPDAYKWAGILSFPWVDGLGQHSVEHICLFYYDQKLYGWAPSDEEEHRRFTAPLEPADLHRPYALLKFANGYLAEVSPAGERWMSSRSSRDGQYLELSDNYFRRTGGGMPTPENFAESEGGLQKLLVKFDAGRVAPPGSGGSHTKLEDLVSIYYYFLEMPNKTLGESPIYGPEPGLERKGIDWGAIVGRQPVSTGDAFKTARELLGERWSQPARVKMRPQGALDNLPSYERVLLFSVDDSVYAYTMENGVWNTEITLGQLQAGDVEEKLAYPGGYTVEGVELLDW
ncbi:MAG: hypothetical protein Q7P63_01935 [Verrucomicrobiota bacterium JB022]|nr:hypothetical protein [Verrucomicrobiota bacterium JB022]